MLCRRFVQLSILPSKIQFGSARFPIPLGFALILLSMFPVHPVFCQNQPAKFDVPAIVEVSPIFNDCILSPEDPYEQLLEIPIPVSCWIEPKYRDSMHEFRFDVYWVNAACPIADYSPKTLLQSPVNGFVAIEKKNDQTVKVGGNSTIPAGSVSIGANVESATNSGTIERFEAVPQHDLLVASGSINRGTGVFFRFHASKQFALEGGREIRLIYRVPKSWRGGLLRVDCTALGTIKKFPGFIEDIHSSLAFVVPVYLKGDHAAHELALKYVQSEQSLRQNWANYLSTKTEPTLLQQMQRNLSQTQNPLEPPADFATRVIEASLEERFEQEFKFPSHISRALAQFSDSRRNLVSLGQ